jgi:hypothetical protein
MARSAMVSDPAAERKWGLWSFEFCFNAADFLVASISWESNRPNSRKKVLLGYYVFALVTNLFVIAMILLQSRVETWHLVIAMTFGSLGVSVYYPAQFAFNQEVLSRAPA